MLSTAAPLYQFNDPALKPWHLKGTYQLYDDSGNPSWQGTYEYFWSAPDMYRSTWTRANATYTEWHTADGKTLSASSGDRLFYFEHQIAILLFSPLPDLGRLDATGLEIEKDQLEAGKIRLPCAIVKTHKGSDGTFPALLGRYAATYCFGPSAAVLRVEQLFGSVFIEFDNLAVTQHRLLPRNITVSHAGQKLLAFTVTAVGDIPKDDPALIPPAGAKREWSQDLAASTAQARLIGKAIPVYPEAAKMHHISGTVILDATIETDGRVKDIRVLSTPSPMLTGAAKDAVSRWQYTPYVVDGQPTPVDTIINVIFALSN